MRNKYYGELWAIRVVLYMLKHSLMLKHGLTHLIVKFDIKLVLHFRSLTIIAKKEKEKMPVLIETADPFLHKFFKFTLWRCAQLLRNFIRLERSWKNFIKLRYYNFCRRQCCWALWSLTMFYLDYDPTWNNIVTVFNMRFSEIFIFLFSPQPMVLVGKLQCRNVEYDSPIQFLIAL